jgi:hypothetical protein
VNRPKFPRKIGPILLMSSLSAGALLAAPDARTQASALLTRLAGDAEAARVGAESISKGQAALRRAEQLRKAGDQQRGALLEQTALEWATAADLLDKTARREKELATLEAHTTELETKVFRTQALVEQTVARRARAEEALRKLEEKAGKP